MKDKKNLSWRDYLSIIGLILFVAVLYYVWFQIYVIQPHKEELVTVTLDIKNKLSPNIKQNEKYIFDKVQMDELLDALKKMKTEQEKANKQFINTKSLTVSTLHGFYASLFTAIAVIVGIAALIGWRRIRELTEKLEQFKKIEKKVDFMDKRREWAEWAREKFDSEDSSITSSKIKYTDEEKKRIKEIEDRLLNDFIEVSWLEVIYAKELIDKDKREHLNDEQIIRRFKSAYRILDFILLKGMSDNCILNNNHNSKLEGKVYHFLGQLVWEYYSKMKESFYNNRNGVSKDNFKEWKDESINDLTKEGKFTLKECLNLSKEYYEKAKSIKEIKGEKTYETIGNLAIVLIEFAKLGINRGYLKKASEYLEKVGKSDEATFNTYWDLARYYYYKDKNKCKNEISHNLYKAVDGIEKFKHKGIFSQGIKDEFEETGFPGKDDLIEELRKKLDPKTI